MSLRSSTLLAILRSAGLGPETTGAASTIMSRPMDRVDGFIAVVQILQDEFGPPVGRPVILPGGMIGDRATVFVASAAEIGVLIKGRD
jgi:hypothetical protein